ncbi:hypothetical protein GGS24DRAFT_515464 [Hypoxylon argillaceum]|nr:hypothetical protein GGS24DRAFT_515464 [Hypoxylon argillaceum]
MPPLLALVRRAFEPGRPSSALSEQWKNPSDVFSVLLILGGDVVARALAQLAGSRLTPVAFSFGWVAYGVTAVVSAVGENKLMPPADFPCIVINGKNGYVRSNNSWIIGRIVRDFDAWKDRQPRAASPDGAPVDADPNPVARCVRDIIDRKWSQLKEEAKKNGDPEPEIPPKGGLCVSVYRARKATKGYPGYDAPYVTGFLTCVVQLGVAAIPCGVSGDWSILLVTAVGTALAFATGGLSQWAREKWACPSGSKKTFVLTTGNGSQQAIVIQGAGVGLDLEDLAAAEAGMFALRETRAALIGIGILWILLLIAATGISQNTWFLLAVGALGIAQNVFVAGKSRSPEAFGMPLEFVEVFGEEKVMDSLFAVEESYPGLGKSMLPIFFTGELKEKEKAKWDEYDRARKLNKTKHDVKNQKKAAKHQVTVVSSGGS